MDDLNDAIKKVNELAKNNKLISAL